MFLKWLIMKIRKDANAHVYQSFDWPQQQSRTGASGVEKQSMHFYTQLQGMQFRMIIKW